MKLLADTHFHTNVSAHAYSTLQEVVQEAANKGLELVAMTDHGPQMDDGAVEFHFRNLRTLPEEIYGVRVLKGIELNVLNFDGDIDLEEDILKRLDFVIASFHESAISPGNINQNTKAAINVLRNPFIDVIGHPDNPRYPINIEEVVKAAKEYGKLMELNNLSFKVRQGGEENIINIIKYCKEYGVKMCVGSDAHISFDIGELDNIYRLLQQEKVPEELILNTSKDKVLSYIKERREI